MIAVLLAIGCNRELVLRKERDLRDIALDDVQPRSLVEGSLVELVGSDFVPDLAGPTTVRFEGALDGRAVDLPLTATFVDYDRMELDWPGLEALDLQPGRFEGTVRVRAPSSYDQRTHASEPLPVTMDWVDHLEPEVEEVTASLRFVNDTLVVEGDDLLVGGEEGSLIGVFDGCFTVEGRSGCNAVADFRVPALAGGTRQRAEIAFTPDIAGLLPGDFEGSLQLINRHADGTERRFDDSFDLAFSLREPEIEAMSPSSASLGQYVEIVGGGFVGPTFGDPSATTLVELVGDFRPDDGGKVSVRLTLIPEYVEGRLLRYVLSEQDDLGRTVDLRTVSGAFEGTATPITFHGREEVEGRGAPVGFRLEPVKQVIWLRFLPSYVESLYHFGLRGADARVRDRIVDVVERDYAGVHVDIRLEEPEDFALYSVVEISGPDPNGLGLLGYDNTPGKDVGNERLYDWIGGVNALTQLDGYPGYGGVFIESLFSYSRHPGGFAESADVDRRFDQLFDPFRPDRDGSPVLVSEADAASIDLDNDVCPASGRKQRVDCAIFTLGNLVGTTVSHEIAHSVGLADPDGEDFHNTGDWTDALMDGGSYRTFGERAEIGGEGPGSFCRVNYEYLRRILPTDEPDPMEERQDCY